MSAGSKLSVALIGVLLAFGLAACGGEDDSGSAATDAVSQERLQNGEGADGAAGAGAPANDGKTEAGSGSDSPDDSAANEDSSSEGSDDFVPRQHDDSGGGSAPFRVSGGDNSVQEFGAEAADPELEAAAAALHNFLDARGQEAWASACSFLSAEVSESLEAFVVKSQEAAEKQGKSIPEDTSCATVLSSLTNRAALPELRKEAAAADVRSLRVEGDRAFLIYTGLGGTVIAIPVVNENGSWKVASLAGAPIA
jgi:hypothetical protein